MDAAGYEIARKLYESEATLVYRALRAYDRQPVILKVLKPEVTTIETLVHFRREYDITAKLDLPRKSISLAASPSPLAAEPNSLTLCAIHRCGVQDVLPFFDYGFA